MKTMFEVISLSAIQDTLKGHTIHGQFILPGVAFIDIINLVASKRLNTPACHLSNLVIEHPVFLTGDGLKIAVSLSGNELMMASEIGDKVYARCTVTIVDEPLLAEITSEPLPKSKTKSVTPCYLPFSALDLKHEGFMKAEGHYQEDDAWIYAHLSTNHPAFDYQHFFYPTYMDAAGVIALSDIYAQRQRLFLPLHFESIQLLPFTDTQCRVKISKIQQHSDQDDVYLIKLLEIYDSSNKIVGKIKNWRLKLVRDISTFINSASKKQLPVSGSTHLVQDAVVQDALEKNKLSHIPVDFAKPIIQQVVNLLPSDDFPLLTDGYYQLGINSVGMIALTSQISQHLEQALEQTLLFEYTNLKDLLLHLWQLKHPTQEAIKTLPSASEFSLQGLVDEPIAIIGVSGKFPMADNLQELHENFKQGKDCISEIPLSRWDYRQHFSLDKKIIAKNYCKYGGFISQFNYFEPLYFGITPKEARLMDPNERLFLQVAYQSLEDAGYHEKNVPREVGVFVGAMCADYDLYGAESLSRQKLTSQVSWLSFVPTRVSYFYNFSGPSLTVDTACSSSLTALHLACQSLQNGECEMALVGGVNLTIHPLKYISLCSYDLLAIDGKCHTFGAGGSGYVPAESVGAVVLKPLSRALQDNNHIYGIIKATAMSHGGRSGGFLVPNVSAQQDAIEKALKKAKVNPESISYVEAHGTGTQLGDPIEIKALTAAYQNYTDKLGYCAIGSAKSNLGHAEGAAGIVGLIKVLLQFKYKMLYPSLHNDPVNPHIDFSQTPFVVQKHVKEWVTETSEPRRAGLSSFGASGTNVHVVLEEHVPAANPLSFGEHEPFIFTFSAFDKPTLQRKIDEMYHFLGSNNLQQSALPHISYTLNVGRRHHRYRTVFIAKTIKDLRSQLKVVDVASILLNNEKLRFSYEDLCSLIAKSPSAEPGLLQQLAIAYQQGSDIPWQELYSSQTFKMCSLPTYPFLGECYWAPEPQQELSIEKIHPLIDKNTSTFNEHKYVKKLTAEEHWLTDHVILGSTLVPGACYLEMAVAAAQEASGETVIKIENITWERPCVFIDKDIDIQIELKQTSKHLIAFTIYSKSSPQVIYSQGSLLLGPYSKLCTQLSFSARGDAIENQQIYQHFEHLHYQYGASYRVIDALYVEPTGLFSKLSLKTRDNSTGMIIHPGLVDGVFQTIKWLDSGISREEVYVPFGLESLEIYAPLQRECLVETRVEAVDAQQTQYGFNVFNCDGTLALKLKGFVARKVQSELQLAASQLDGFNNSYFHSAWERVAMPIDRGMHLPVSMVFLPKLKNNDKQWLDLLRYFSQQPETILVIRGDRFHVQNQNLIEINVADEGCYQRVMELLVRHEKVTLLDVYCESSIDVSTQMNRLMEHYTHLVKATVSVLAHQKVHAWTLYFQENQTEINPFYSIASFAKGVVSVNHQMQLALIGLSLSGQSMEQALDKSSAIISNHVARSGDHFLLQNIDLYQYVICPLNFVSQNEYAEMQAMKGVFLVTGGLGGLGKVIAKYLCSCSPEIQVLLCGRRQFSQSELVNLAQDWGVSSEQLFYKQADIADVDDCKCLFDYVVNQWGELQGIVHAAGIGEAPNVLFATQDSIASILSSKVQGTLNLDYFSKTMHLKHFLLFSSISAQLGDFGMGVYAGANAFLDSFSLYRNELVTNSQRFGPTTSINWPYWADTGMPLPMNTDTIYYNHIGMAKFNQKHGLAAFELALQKQPTQMIVTRGDSQKIRRAFKVEQPQESSNTPANPTVGAEGVIKDLVLMVSELTEIPADHLDLSMPFFNYGVDSITLLELRRKIEDKYVKIPNDIFFNQDNILALSAYITQTMGTNHDVDKAALSSNRMLHLIDELSDEEIEKLLTELE